MWQRYMRLPSSSTEELGAIPRRRFNGRIIVYIVSALFVLYILRLMQKPTAEAAPEKDNEDLNQSVFSEDEEDVAATLEALSDKDGTLVTKNMREETNESFEADNTPSKHLNSKDKESDANKKGTISKHTTDDGPIIAEQEMAENEMVSKGMEQENDPAANVTLTVDEHALADRVRKLLTNTTTSRASPHHPNLVFIKGLKVGGTSVAYALNRASLHYEIPLARVNLVDNLKFHPAISCDHIRGGRMYFHHGFRSSWEQRCIPGVRFTTLLREPLSQAISWESMALNRDYYINKPARACPKPRYMPISNNVPPKKLLSLLSSTNHCVDSPFRKNITMMLIADRVRRFKEGNSTNHGYPGAAVALTTKWIMSSRDYGRIQGKDVIHSLKHTYFLVGVTERLNEFLVLLALVNGWDLRQLYFVKCKPTDLDIHRQEFEKYFPELAEKIRFSSKPATEAYNWVKQNFDKLVKSLGDDFKAVVRKYETGLRHFQSQHVSRGWKPMYYRDGQKEYC